MPHKVQLKKRSSAMPKWCKEAPDLFNSICRYADLLDKSYAMPPPGDTFTESRLREMSISLYLERLEGYTEAIVAFTGIRYKFICNDSYYGIRDTNENFIYKVFRHQK